ncbi:MAG: amidohydrolase family protein [Acidobacteriota bacterium]
MTARYSRREWLLASAGGLAARPKGVLVDTHIHLFDPKRFPYHPNATYRPPAQTLEDYVKFVAEARIDHSIIVHPEPYQDDHSYLEYCFAHEPRRGFFKGTCLFDPVAAETPARMEALTKKLPGRIVTLRIHVNRDPKAPPTTSGAIRDRDLRAPAMKDTWRKAGSLGLAIQMHFIPYYAPQIFALASEFRDVAVILDHLARAGQGTEAEYGEVLKLAKLPRVYMKYSAVRYSSKQDYPHRDARPLVRRVFDAFGPERIIWGGLGMSMADFEKQAALLDQMFEFASEADRARIRGGNAVRLFALPL